MNTHLISTAQLADDLGEPDLRIVDATWYLPTLNRDARADYERCHIEGAVYFDIDDIADDTSALPHMLPDATKFSSRVRKLGLGDGLRVVIYDSNSFCASARAWWMFRLFGHGDVKVLDGGLRKWLAEGLPVTDEPSSPKDRHFTARQNNLLLRELDQMRSNLTSAREQVIDARSRGRFKGSEPEPRAHLRAGHIPGSRNLPYGELIEADGTMKPARELESIFAQAGIDLARPIVTTCGSGVSAAVINLALAELGNEEVGLYDGSWSQWGSLSNTPVAQ